MCAVPTALMRAQRGFTLIELLVAISVMALLSLMSWQALDGMGRTEALTRQRTDDVLVIQAGLGQWGADLDAMMETGYLPAIDFDGRTLRLTRRDALESTHTSPGVQVVAWGLQDGRWTRWQSSGLNTRGTLLQAWEAAARWGQRPRPMTPTARLRWRQRVTGRSFTSGTTPGLTPCHQWAPRQRPPPVTGTTHEPTCPRRPMASGWC
jgi:prepilin-type N-terminal cleavage/methylation domain-containing protein